MHEVNQQQAFTQGCLWARELGCAETDHCILLEDDMGTSRARAVSHYAQLPLVICGALPVPVSEVMHLSIGESAMESLLHVERMVKEVSVGSSHNVSWSSGRVSGTVAFRPELKTEASKSEEKAFGRQHQQHEANIDAMRELLLRDGSEDMESWAQRLGLTDMANFPPTFASLLANLIGAVCLCQIPMCQSSHSGLSYLSQCTCPKDQHHRAGYLQCETLIEWRHRRECVPFEKSSPCG